MTVFQCAPEFCALGVGQVKDLPPCNGIRMYCKCVSQSAMALRFVVYEAEKRQKHYGSLYSNNNGCKLKIVSQVRQRQFVKDLPVADKRINQIK